MNIKQSNQGFSQGFSPLFYGAASPYLSPLFGTASQRQLSSPDDFTDFRLQEDDEELLHRQLPQQSVKEEISLLLPIQEVGEQMELFNDPPKEEKPEVMTPAFLPKSTSSPILQMICFLVENDDLPEEQILLSGKSFSQGFEGIFRILLTKFKKLKKTKEEMIKFCMRKAFKFCAESKKACKNSKVNKKGEKINEKSVPLEMPFRKNSSQKTMNSQFLKQVFSSSEFVENYESFLKTLPDIIREDNLAKIEYLAETIQKMNEKDKAGDLINIKRLPWTKTILTKTEKLAKSLIIDYGSEAVLVPQKNDDQY